MSTDFTKLPNPYDFANPVSDSRLFIGRKEQLDLIRYYLENAKIAARPINIAILGRRASGKTSLLNMAELEAKARGFCVVRVDLDEGDAQNQLAFFHKLFDGLISAAVDTGAFGGVKGKTFDVYLDMVNAYVTPEDRTFCPFIFPLQYAKAMASERGDVLLSDHAFRTDLRTISREVGKPIAILFDEGNVLGASRVHLEKLRNIFMNVSGYMLILTGTPDLFPLMDDVFSPIVRQFKRIEIEEFKNLEDTEECIRRPLETIGIEQPDAVFDTETVEDVEELHELSGGRPYEIQLLCHHMFRRLQTRRARKMTLDFGVLEDVRRDLESTQDIDSRPVLAKMRHASEEDLDALRLLCMCDGRAIFDEIWAVHHMFDSATGWTKDGLAKKAEELLSREILRMDSGRIGFAGDDFDKIYTKYLARERGVVLHFGSNSVEWYCQFRLMLSGEEIKGLRLLGTSSKHVGPSLAAVIAALQPEAIGDPFVEAPSKAMQVYFMLLDNQGQTGLKVVNATVRLFEREIYVDWYSSSDHSVALLSTLLTRIGNRLRDVGGELVTNIVDVKPTPLDSLATKVQNTANEELREEIVRRHNQDASRNYVDKGEVKLALMHAELAYRYTKQPSSEQCNNLGYLYMIKGDYGLAAELFNRALNIDYSREWAALAAYNLGVLKVKAGQLASALEDFEESARRMESQEKRYRLCSCLQVPFFVSGQITFREVKTMSELVLGESTEVGFPRKPNEGTLEIIGEDADEDVLDLREVVRVARKSVQSAMN